MKSTSLRRAVLTGGVASSVVMGTLSAPAFASTSNPTAPATTEQGLGLSPAVVTRLNRALAEVTLDGSQHEVRGSTLASLCGETNFTVWIRTHTQGWSAADRQDADTLATITLLQAVYAPPAKRTFGTKGQYTQVLGREMARLRTFWNVNGKRVNLLPAHGTSAKNVPSVARVLRNLGGMSRTEATAAARLIARKVNQKKFGYGNHPMLTLNAFATPAYRSGGATTAPSIVIGDGILQAMSQLGWNSVAPQEILAHEYGHQIQYANRSVRPGGSSTPAQTRYAELQADAYGAYFLRHPKGGNMGWRNVNTFLQVVYATGDCSFTSTSHHGTPSQRMAAANWGAGMVQAVGAGRIATTKGFANAYKKVHPRIVK